MFQPREGQREVLAYTGGWMGVAAVPGSGKTRTLSALAARLVAMAPLEDDQEVLIVTLVNSAVDHFARQVGEFMRGYGLLPGYGYRVRTLHGLANDIVRERPALVGLEEQFAIIDERESEDILNESVTAYLKAYPTALDGYLAEEYYDNATVRNRDIPEALLDVARNFIRQAKDWQLTPEELHRPVESSGLPLARLGLAIYTDYQRALNYRGAVDFQDLIRLAYRALQLDGDYLKRLRHRWPYVLEDEAQDSSKLQEDTLRLLVGTEGNWVRVGDPNQAIYETFTTADPLFLRSFLREDGVQPQEMPRSGRSSQSIIRLANFLVDWTLTRHPSQQVRLKVPLQSPLIKPVESGDPQPNPEDTIGSVYIEGKALSGDDEIEWVVRSLRRWLPAHPDQTAAVLVPRNHRGFQVVDALKKAGLPHVEKLQSTTSTREAAGALAAVLRYLTLPDQPGPLAAAYRSWQRRLNDDETSRRQMETVARLLLGCRQPETFVDPREGRDWLLTVDASEELRSHLDIFRGLARRWLRAAGLPIDQLLLTVGGDLFQGETDLAVTYSIAVVLRREASAHPDWRLPQFADELERVAKNERRFLGLSEDDTGFDPDRHKGKVTVMTMHGAKGLEWDRVYLMAVNNYDFPSALDYDRYQSERYFARDGLNLEAEALAQQTAIVNGRPYREGEASRAARVDYAAERLRLLYVGITRARRELAISWNTGKNGDLQEAVPLAALRAYRESESKA